MAGTGLQELLETIFASNTVTHILSGKAVARAVRDHLLLDTALNTVLMAKTFSLQLNGTSATDDHDDDNTSEDIDPLSDSVLIDEEIPLSTEIQELGRLVDELLEGQMVPFEITSSKAFHSVKERLLDALNAVEHRTGKLWFMYMKLIDIVRNFLRSERTGDWKLHLATLQNMLPYFAASGHNLCTKSVYPYLQKMWSWRIPIQISTPSSWTVLHVVRRSDRYWAGLSTDLVIEQVLMRSLKTTVV